MRSLVVGTSAIISLLVITALFTPPREAFGFGGEDVIDGNPWHHEDITRRGLIKSDRYEGIKDFKLPAANAIAWHADYIDSYLYNPLFWAKGIGGEKSFARLDAALAGYANLAKLHFDDTSTTSGLRANFERYASGTLAGLYWASLQGANGDVAAGQNILGVSFHAVQDFYSHSNWVDDPQRRCKTWFQVDPKTRNGMALYSGAYELPRANAPAHHGAYSLSCSLVRGDTLDKVLDPICTGYSPYQNSSLCEEWRLCRGGKATTISVQGERNDKLVFLDPPGIALDTTWLARVQAANRRLVDDKGKFAFGKDGMHFRREACKEIIGAPSGRQVCAQDADQIFAGVKDLAIRSTAQWGEYLEAAMADMGPRQKAFWGRLKSEKSDEITQSRQYEDFSKLPYQFLAAGPYPSANPSTMEHGSTTDANGWYLRVRVKTAKTPLAETDSDIYARVRVNGRDEERPLDYLPTDDAKGRTDNRLLVFDDFEAERDVVYTIGPFANRPQSLAFRNDASSSLETVAALFKDLGSAATGAVTTARRALISLIAGDADYVGATYKLWTYSDLDRVVPANNFNPAIDQTLVVDGADQGKHEITYRVRRMPANLTADERANGWMALEVQLYTLKTLKESKLDRTTGADEPFVIFHVGALNGRTDPAHTYLTEPLKEMDEGDLHVFGRRTGTAAIVKVPRGGGLVISTQVFESDSENQGDRDELMRTFASGFDEKTRAPAKKFGDEIGRLFGAGWTPDFVEAFAFKRGAIPEAGQVLARRPVSEVRGDEVSPAIGLDWSQVKPLLTSKHAIDSWSAKPVDAKVLDGAWHARGYACDAPLPHDAIDVAVKGDALEAKQIEATPCATAGQVSWRGTFKDGIVTGEFRKTPSAKEREAARIEAARRALPKPNYRDVAIHPMLSLEGNWMIEWQNTKQKPAYAVLSKGPQYSCVTQEGGGCWYGFKRDPAAKWNVSLVFPPHGAGGGATIGATGEMDVAYPYGVLGHWGGKAKNIATDEAIVGQWTYHDDKGSEKWRRVRGKVTEVESMTAPTAARSPLAKPVTVTVPYVDPSHDLRGNRPSAELRLYGRDLWGLHYYWLARGSDVEIEGMTYICAYDGKNGYPTHRTYAVCLNQGGVLGVVLPLNIWPNARSGPHTLHFDDQEIVFNLKVTGEPQETASTDGWRPIKLEMKSCSMLREVDAPQGTTPLEFRRADFRPR